MNTFTATHFFYICIYSFFILVCFLTILYENKQNEIKTQKIKIYHKTPKEFQDMWNYYRFLEKVLYNKNLSPEENNKIYLEYVKQLTLFPNEIRRKFVQARNEFVSGKYKGTLV